MKTFLLSFLGGLAALVLFFLLLPVLIIGALSGGEDETISGDVVLAVDLRAAYPDQRPTEGPAAFFGQLSFTDILTRLDAAASDPDVKGVFVRSSEFGFGSARAEELRAAFQKLRANDKFVMAHSQGFMSGGPSAYRAISAADDIWLQPGSDFNVSGLAFETLFFKGLLDRLGVTAEIEALREYKNAPNVYKETGYTESHAEALEALGEGIWSVSIADISEDRGLEADALRTLLEAGPKGPDDALELGLIDRLGWPEDASDAAIDRAGGAEMVDISFYAGPAPGGGAPVIALVGGEGPIIPGASGGDVFSFNSDPVFASDTVSAALLAAAEDEEVEAVVFRVDSPGGSATACEQIWRAVERVKEAGKPVVVSMGSVAASCGYYVAMGADAILASETTITGSIGVFGGKIAIADGLRQIGVTPDQIQIGGEVAAAYSTERLTDVQREALVASLERFYDRFTTLAAEGRGMDVEALRAVAKGRVWTGADALSAGLVDETGGLIDAIEKAKTLAGVDPDADVELRTPYEDLRPIEALASMLGVSARQAQSLAFLSAIAGGEDLKDALRQAQALERSPIQAAMPPLREN